MSGLMNTRHAGLSFLLLILSWGAWGQREQGDLNGSRPKEADTAKVNVLTRQILTLRETDPGKAIKLCQETISLSQQLGYQKGIARATGSLGWIYFRQGDFVKALDYSIEALKISEKVSDKQEMARSLNNLAAIYNEEREFSKSLNALNKAHQIALEIGDNRTIARSLNNIALLYMESWKNADSAGVYASRARTIAEQNKDEYNAAFSNSTLG